MELFKAGNESQIETVKKWISESDIYLLILGGRYGNLEPESQLSYTETEYDYAIKQGIPVFSVIFNKSYLYEKQSKNDNLNIFEIEKQNKLNFFKEKVKKK